MQRQISFAQNEFAGKKRTTRREKFLAEMEVVVPWVRLVALIEPHYPKGERGRPPMGIERMLRIYFLQQWNGLADELLEATIYDSQAMRGYTGVEKREELAAKAGKVKWYVAMKRGKRKAMAEGGLKEATQAFEKAKAQVRALVEHPFHILKNLFKHRKTRYRGLAKNTAQLHTLFALVNLVIAKRELLTEGRA
jgi:Transposase DDE domain/Transposase domain (DUF772)